MSMESRQQHVVLLLIFENTADAILGDLRFRLPCFAALLGLVKGALHSFGKDISIRGKRSLLTDFMAKQTE